MATPFPSNLFQKSVFLAGPTASGKSAIAMELAVRLQGELISVDSMQVYRRMDVGTAKPGIEDRNCVRHHLLDVIDPKESFDAARFLALALAAMEDIQARGRIPILCGGTGLYFKALLQGLGEAPASDPVLRARLNETPLPDLLAELQHLDPESFERIDRNNPRRVIRALEIVLVTGKPASPQRAIWSTSAPAQLFAIKRDAGDLRRRIDARVDWMFEHGLIEETRSLLATGLDAGATSLQAIGYRQVIEHLQGERSAKETIELVKIRTRQYAKRQMTWFRRQLPCEWLYVTANESARQVADRILEKRESISREAPPESHPPRVE